jgi:hypothetical protein
LPLVNLGRAGTADGIFPGTEILNWAINFKFRRSTIMAKNCEMKVENNILTINIDLTKDFGKSASGKTNIIATTEGNISVPGNNPVKIGLNVYKYPTDK